MQLEAELILTLRVKCEEPMAVKDDLEGYLRMIPIVGGTFEGRIRGTIISGGADWNTEMKDGISHVFAKYLLKTDDDEYISVENSGIIHWDDAAQIKTVLQFQADKNGKYAWLNTGVYVGGLKVIEAHLIEITVYQMK